MPSEVVPLELAKSADWRQRMHFLKEAMLLLVNLNMDMRREILDRFEDFGLLEPWLATIKIILSMSEEVAGASRQHAAEMLCLLCLLCRTSSIRTYTREASRRIQTLTESGV